VPAVTLEEVSSFICGANLRCYPPPMLYTGKKKVPTSTFMACGFILIRGLYHSDEPFVMWRLPRP